MFSYIVRLRLSVSFLKANLSYCPLQRPQPPPRRAESQLRAHICAYSIVGNKTPLPLSPFLSPTYSPREVGLMILPSMYP